MPLLEPAHVAALLADARGERACISTYQCICGGWIVKDYCRSCDEFYDYGHLADCVLHRKPEHAGHRTYLVPFVEG